MQSLLVHQIVHDLVTIRIYDSIIEVLQRLDHHRNNDLPDERGNTIADYLLEGGVREVGKYHAYVHAVDTSKLSYRELTFPARVVNILTS